MPHLDISTFYKMKIKVRRRRHIGTPARRLNWAYHHFSDQVALDFDHRNASPSSS